MATFTLANLMVFDGTSQSAKRMSSGLGSGNTLDFGAGTLAAGAFSGALSGNASTATTLATSRDFSLSGDATASAVSFNGGADVDLNVVLANTAVTAGNYGGNAAKTVAFTVDSKGRITAASDQDISIAHTQISDWAEATGDFLTSANLSGYVQDTRKVLGDGTTIDNSGDGSLSSDVTLSLHSVHLSALSFNDASKTLSIGVDVYGRVTSLSEQAISIDHTQISDWSTATADFLTSGDISGKAGLADTQTFTGTNTFTEQVVMSGGAHITGTLRVDGPIISEGATNLSTADAFINLRLGGSSTGAGGLAINGEGLGSALTGATFSSKADNGGTGHRATIAVSDASGISVGDLIQVSASNANSGYFFVAAKGGTGNNTLSIYTSQEDSLADAPFASNDVVSGTESGAVVQKVVITAIAVSDGSLPSLTGVIAKGLPCYAKGSTYAQFGVNLSGSPVPSGWTILVPGVESALVGVVALGDILAYNSSGEAVKAGNSLSGGLYEAALVALEANASGTATKPVALSGAKAAIVNTGSLLATAGTKLYLDTNGKATDTAPTASGTVVVEIGKVVGAGFNFGVSDKAALVRFAPKVVIVND